MFGVQEVGKALVDACMGCPLPLTLAVGAIRQAAQAPPDADLMADKYMDCWRAIRKNESNLLRRWVAASNMSTLCGKPMRCQSSQ
jgi:hypothetical protein